MNRTPIASPLLLVGRDATETWHGSDDGHPVEDHTSPLTNDQAAKFWQWRRAGDMR